ncbi:MAG: tetratricopeptide repeat protein [Nitrospirota bacterium]|nr:MAG: tetratricopeptide repeat protein [Nitrospirota bacterium]
MSLEDIEKLKEKLSKNPDSKLFVPLSEEYRKEGMFDEAIEVLKQGLEIQPSYMSARVALGKIYVEKEMLEEARDEFAEVIKAIPDNLFAHKKLAEIYRDMGDPISAIKQYDTVLMLNPLDEEAEASKKELAVAAEEARLREEEDVTDEGLDMSAAEEDEIVESIPEEEEVVESLPEEDIEEEVPDSEPEHEEIEYPGRGALVEDFDSSSLGQEFVQFKDTINTDKKPDHETFEDTAGKSAEEGGRDTQMFFGGESPPGASIPVEKNEARESILPEDEEYLGKPVEEESILPDDDQYLGTADTGADEDDWKAELDAAIKATSGPIDEYAFMDQDEEKIEEQEKLSEADSVGLGDEEPEVHHIDEEPQESEIGSGEMSITEDKFSDETSTSEDKVLFGDFEPPQEVEPDEVQNQFEGSMVEEVKEDSGISPDDVLFRGDLSKNKREVEDEVIFGESLPEDEAPDTEGGEGGSGGYVEDVWAEAASEMEEIKEVVSDEAAGAPLGDALKQPSADKEISAPERPDAGQPEAVEDIWAEAASGAENITETASEVEVADEVTISPAEPDITETVEVPAEVEVTEEETVLTASPVEQMPAEEPVSVSPATDDLSAEIARAEELVSQSRFADAIMHYEKLVSEYPDDKKVQQKFQELKSYLKMLGKDKQVVVERLESFLQLIKIRGERK